MLQDRLTSLAVLHVHRGIDIDIDMRSFTLGKSRHIDFGCHIVHLLKVLFFIFFIFVIKIWQNYTK
jgi:hypothetical protein